MRNTLPMLHRLLALAGVLSVFALIWLYTREFPVFSNTIDARKLVLGAGVAGALVAAGILYGLRNRLRPFERHLPEFFSISLLCILFMPLFASLLNRAGGRTAYQSFEFLSEKPYFASAYGLLQGEKVRPTGYQLQIRDGQRLLRVQYKSQAYYPLSKPGDQIQLPVREGLFGFQVFELK